MTALGLGIKEAASDVCLGEVRVTAFKCAYVRDWQHPQKDSAKSVKKCARPLKTRTKWRKGRGGTGDFEVGLPPAARLSLTHSILGRRQRCFHVICSGDCHRY